MIELFCETTQIIFPFYWQVIAKDQKRSSLTNSLTKNQRLMPVLNKPQPQLKSESLGIGHTHQSLKNSILPLDKNTGGCFILFTVRIETKPQLPTTPARC